MGQHHSNHTNIGGMMLVNCTRMLTTPCNDVVQTPGLENVCILSNEVQYYEPITERIVVQQTTKCLS